MTPETSSILAFFVLFFTSLAIGITIAMLPYRTGHK